MTDAERKMRETLSSILADVSFTPVQRKILAILADGEPHPSREMVGQVLDDPMSTKLNLSDHITSIRGKIKRFNHTIVCEFRKRTMHYRYVIHLNSLISSD